MWEALGFIAFILGLRWFIRAEIADVLEEQAKVNDVTVTPEEPKG